MNNKKHIILVGFLPFVDSLLDYDRYDVSIVAHTHLIELLPAEMKQKFLEVGVLDVPHNINVEECFQAKPQLEELVADLVEKHGLPHAFVALFEHSVLPAAILRAKCGLPGVSVQTALSCRDKVTMKRIFQKVSSTLDLYPFHLEQSCQPSKILLTVYEGLSS